MDERPEPQRIEIELTTNAEMPDRTRHHLDQPPAPSSEVVVGSDEAAPTGWLGSERGRLVVTATVVGLMALALGWSLGRVGGSGDVATSSVTAPESTAPGTTVVLEGESLPPPQITTTVPKPRPSTTTSTLPSPVVEAVEVDQRLQGLDLTLVGLDNSNALVELDLAAGTITTQKIGWAGGEPGALIAGTDWIILNNPSSGTSLLLRDDGRSQPVDIGYGWQPLWIADTDRFWRGSETQSWDARATFEEVDITGTPTGVAVELPAGTWPMFADADGGLVVLAAGKNYSVHESSIDLIGAGDLLGLSSDLSVLRDCDAQLQCGIRVTDRRTGEVRPLPTDPTAGEAPLLQGPYGWGATSTNSISPDGGLCVVIVQTSQNSTLGLVDLRTGALAELGSNLYAPAVVWSADGRFAFFLDGQGLSAYDRQSAEVFPVLQDSARWTSLASRPNGS